MKNPSSARLPGILLLGLLPLAWVWSCMEPAPDAYYLDLALEDSTTYFQRVSIVLLDPGTGKDTIEVLWDDSIPNVDALKKRRTRRYRGEDVLVIVRGYNQGQLLYERRIAYSSATRTAIIDSFMVRDTLPPTYASRIPTDTLFLRSWKEFPDSLVTCLDNRDGVLKHYLDTLPRESQPPSWYITIVYCRDLARNSTWKHGDTLMVYMDPLPRPGKPVITLAKRDSVDLPVGSDYAKEASCRDPEDGSLPVEASGNVNPRVLGKYAVTFRCRDRDSNEAVRQQVVWVSDTLDRDPPAADLNGPDSIDHQLGEPYHESGGTCVDLRDGPRPMIFSPEVDVHTPGVYSVEFKCRDLTGNTTYPVRKVRVVSYAVAPVKAEVGTDTTAKSNFVNSGLTPLLSFGKPVDSEAHVTMLAFDLKGVRRDSVKAARAYFQTYISGPYIASLDSVRVVFRVHRIKSPWVEGTGNWYFNRGYYQNRGHIALKNYSIREEMRALSTDPAVRSGFTKEEAALIRAANREESGGDTAWVSYGPEHFSGGHPGTVPERRLLVPLDIDLTRYVKETPEGEDYGFVITADGLPANNWISWATKELEDGSLAPYLKVFYP
jgi:hypothetical protein